MTAVIISVCLVAVLVLAFITSKDREPATATSGGGAATSVKGGVNNPGYLIVSNAGWQGSEHYVGQHFENFNTMENGIRAWGINLFQKIKSGKITSPNSMIDVLTPAGSDNPEQARINYKAAVNKATNWISLFYAVFQFENNPTWRVLSEREKTAKIALGLAAAIIYCYNGQTPQYFKK